MKIENIVWIFVLIFIVIIYNYSEIVTWNTCQKNFMLTIFFFFVYSNEKKMYEQFLSN